MTDREPKSALHAHPPGYFDREYFVLFPGKRKYLDYLIGLLRRHGVQGGKVLDVGPGYGFFLGALSRAGYRAFGLELSPLAARTAARSGETRVAVGSAEAPLPFPDESFDAVTLLDVIEHIDRYPETLAECHRVLKPGGKLFVITLNAGSLARPILGRKWSFHLDPTHIHMFSKSLLRTSLAAAGLPAVELSTLSNFCSVGEGNPVLRPLRLIGRVIATPWLGDLVLGVGRRAP